jgi:hypothetical protein
MTLGNQGQQPVQKVQAAALDPVVTFSCGPASPTYQILYLGLLLWPHLEIQCCATR